MPPTDAVLAFALIVTLIVTSPGPNLFLLLRTTPAHGRAAGLANTTGFCAAILTHAFLSLVGVGAVLASSSFAFTVLKIIGAAYLVWLGARSLLSAWRGGALAAGEAGSTAHGRGARRTRDGFGEGSGHDVPTPLPPHLVRRFWEGWLTNALNPKPALFYLAAFPHFIALDGAPILLQGMMLGTIHALIALLWYGLVVVGIERATVWLRRPVVWRAVQSLTGIALVALGGRLLFTKAPAS